MSFTAEGERLSPPESNDGTRGTGNGRVDCVDIDRQPAMAMAEMKNHSIQLAPSNPPRFESLAGSSDGSADSFGSPVELTPTAALALSSYQCLVDATKQAQ